MKRRAAGRKRERMGREKEKEKEKDDRLLNEAMHLRGRRARDSSPEASVP